MWGVEGGKEEVEMELSDLAGTPSQTLPRICTRPPSTELIFCVSLLPMTVQIFSLTFLQPAVHLLTCWLDRGLVARN